MKRYLKRLLDIFIFLLVWLGVPHVLAWYTGSEGMYVFVFVTWVAGIFVVGYLNEDLE